MDCRRWPSKSWAYCISELTLIQSLNVIENPQLCKIFLMLWEELCDSDIPHCLTIHAWIIEVWDEHLDDLQKEMKVWKQFLFQRCFFADKHLRKISLTTDMWSDMNLTPFMVVTAHWIKTTTVQMPQGPQHILKLWSDLIGFQRCPGHHTGEHLAQAFLHVLEGMGIICCLPYLCSFKSADWLGYPWQCIKQQHIYGHTCCRAPGTLHSFWCSETQDPVSVSSFKVWVGIH